MERGDEIIACIVGKVVVKPTAKAVGKGKS